MTASKNVWVMLALLFIVGCNSSPNSPQGMPSADESKLSDWLTVSSDSEEIAEALRVAKESANAEYESVLGLLGESNSYLGSDELKTLSSRKDESIRRLREIVLGPNKTAAIGAALVLCQYQDASGLTQLNKFLAQSNSNERVRILQGIQGNWSYDAVQTQEFGNFINADDGIRNSLLRQLDDQDPKVVRVAIQTCGFLKVPGSHDRFVKLLNRDDVSDSDRLMYWLSRGPLDPGLLELAVQRAQSATRRTGSDTSLLEAFARHTDLKLREKARNVLKAKLANNPDDGLGFTGDRLGLISTLAETSDAGDIQWLQALFKHERGMYAEPVLIAILRLEGEAGRQRLVPLLNDHARSSVAANAINKVYRNSRDPIFIEKLLESGMTQSKENVGPICEALLSLSGVSAEKAVRQLMYRLDPIEQSAMNRRLSTTSMRDMAAKAVDAELMDEAEADRAVKAFQNDSKREDTIAPALTDFFRAANRLIEFDAETGELPCRHDRLLLDFAAQCDGKFAPKGIRELWLNKDGTDTDAEYDLQFVYDGRIYHGRLRNLGDWYDLERIAIMINTALADAGGSDRFVPLAADGQIASFVFANPKKLEPFAGAFNMPLSNNADDARQKGRAFESKVIEELKQSK